MFGLGEKKIAENEWQSFETEAMPLMEDLHRVARWLTRDRTEAEDLVQETYFQALKSLSRYQPGTNCRAWLVTILYHLNSKRRYKLGRLQLLQILDDKEEYLAETLAFEPSIPQNVTDEEILAALQKIPEAFRQVILLADVEEFDYKEIAKIMKTPIGTVMSRLHRGRRLLRGELAVYARNFGLKNADQLEEKK